MQAVCDLSVYPVSLPEGGKQGRPCNVEWKCGFLSFFLFLKSQLLLTIDLGITCPDQKIHFAQLGKLFSGKFLFLLKVIIQVLKK